MLDLLHRFAKQLALKQRQQLTYDYQHQVRHQYTAVAADGCRQFHFVVVNSG